MTVTWNKELEIGVEEIDSQHKELFRRCAGLLDACTHGKGKEDIETVFQFLSDYVQTHFADEERLQKQNGYPKYALHHLYHERFIFELAELEEQFRMKGASVSLILQINRKLVDWLIDHIGGMDKEFGTYLHTPQ